MPTITVSLHQIEGTGAMLGRAGRHTIVVDRPEGKAGGMGLGFSGGELLAFALAGGYANNLQFVAHEMGIALGAFAVLAEVEIEGDLITGASIEVKLGPAPAGADMATLLARANEKSTVSNSVAKGFPVTVKVE